MDPITETQHRVFGKWPKWSLIEDVWIFRYDEFSHKLVGLSDWRLAFQAVGRAGITNIRMAIWALTCGSLKAKVIGTIRGTWKDQGRLMMSLIEYSNLAQWGYKYAELETKACQLGSLITLPLAHMSKRRVER